MSTNGWWAITLGLGLVVAVVAVALLQIFLNQLHRVERGAERLWHTGKLVAGNTATTWQLGTTTERLQRLTEEAGRHEQLLRGGPSDPGGR
jgi:hypothetical protein